MVQTLKKNRTRLITLAVLLLLFLTALQGMDREDWAITVLRGLSTGAITFLVASGLSLILGLMDVLNLAHGELFMIGAYVGWTVFVRPDTFVDLLTPICLVSAGLVMGPVWRWMLGQRQRGLTGLAWGALLAGGAVLLWVLPNYPVAIWDAKVFAESPGAFSLALEQGTMQMPASATFSNLSPILTFVLLILGGCLLGLSVATFEHRQQKVAGSRYLPRQPLLMGGLLVGVGLAVFAGNQLLSAALFAMDSTARFFISMGIATLTGFLLGGLIESTLIRPLYSRPIYQIMLTLGLGFIGIELVRDIWGQPEFTMPKAAWFSGSGDGCPATQLSDLLTYHCPTIEFFGGRIRTYNEIFIVLVGLVVLVAIGLLLQRTRLGMIIRAGVQDREMVEALGINVRQVFTFVFALGVSLASLGGVLAAPSIGLSNDMGTRLMLLALIALAIGGLTSFPGAAAGAVLVGLLQQFIIKYGQIGIPLPFLEEPFKPSPPLVPASTVLLMVIILLVLPNGLFGKNE